MVVFPNCKINLGLHITNKRSDGYHDLETVFYPLPWYDVLEILPLTVKAQQDIEASTQAKITYQTSNILFAESGLNIEGNAKNNLCVKAFYLLKSKYISLPPVFMHLHKVIPSGAGLGGGSANAAFILKTIAIVFNLFITDVELENLALTLGSDCPFFIKNKPSVATGRGEQLQLIPLNLDNYTLILVNPKIHIYTSWAFSQIIPTEPKIDLYNIIQQPIENWKILLHNDFEKSVFEKLPAIKKIKEELYNKGALYASLSGSGSTVYGIFPPTIKPKFTFPPEYVVKILPANKNKLAS